MAQTNNKLRSDYDKNTYNQYKYLVRKDSRLDLELKQYKEENKSVGGLVKNLLSEFFKIT